MKIISWNVRGLGSPRATRGLRNFLKQQHPQMVFLMETKIDRKRMEKVRMRCGFSNGIDIDANGTRGGLSLAWKEDLSVTLKSFSSSHIDVMVKDGNLDADSRFTGFYGSPYGSNKDDSWNLLRQLGEDKNHPWLVCGDFNEILYSTEKRGGIPREERKMESFREALEECQLEDMGYSGVRFTWERGNFAATNIRERLDRAVANEGWRTLFPKGTVYHLPHSMSDHCPLVINTMSERTPVRNSQFNVQQSWDSSSGSIVEKLESLQRDLKEWESSIKKGKEGLKKKLSKDLELLMAEERDDATLERIIDTKVRLNLEIDRDELYWEQRARANWLKAGDKNSAFFHKYASTRKRINTISRLQLEDGREVTEENDIAESASSFFKDLFMFRGVEEFSHLLQGIDKKISSDTNATLVSTFTEEEIWGQLKHQDLMGFQQCFFQKYWHIVGKDVTSFCLGILNNGQSFGHLNSTNILLIPKIQNPGNLSNFRPISLCTTIYKIVAKAIANRLQGVMEMCIDESQSAFIPGRLISDNTLVAYEMLHTLRRKRMGNKGFMAVKLDLSKAYDRVEWAFIRAVMLKLGFENKWVELILKCISTASFAVNVNGIRGESFQATRGLSALLKMAQNEGVLKGVKASRSGPMITHLLFADDCILFGEATRKGAREYGEYSGQCVNFSKSSVFFSSNTIEAMQEEVLRILEVRPSTNMEKYLGLPSLVGRRKKDSFQALKEKVMIRIKGWCNRFLSQGGKEVFIKSVLQAIPTYAMSCFLLLKSFCDELERIIAKNHGKRGIQWCQWKNLCCLKEDGGMGFRSLAKFNVALLAKQGWGFMNNPNSLVAKVYKAKYFPNSTFINSSLGSNCSFTWKSMHLRGC
ncbi:reverse transcriptase [Gossypium australe]|uniref:Reverse transcriptase n=1 Tax=Gossypium australe TaxID=47621 RepID=A0A5B6UXQ7_9ROSI|nr:reverse transcriptase [Gossypium australe]